MAELRELVVAGPAPEKHRVARWRCAVVPVEMTRRFDHGAFRREPGG
jgi:hypothetical protein